MKERYEIPRVEMVEIECEDIILTSSSVSGPTIDEDDQDDLLE